MSPLRSTRMASLLPCINLCCSSASLFYHLAFFSLCLHFSDFAYGRYLRLRQVSSLTAGIFVYSRYLLSQQVSVFALTVGRFVFARSKVRPRTGTKNIRVYCWLAGGSGVIILADGCHVALVLLGDLWSSAKCCGGFRQFTLAGRMA